MFGPKARRVFQDATHQAITSDIFLSLHAALLEMLALVEGYRLPFHDEG
jgi:hypothetical protein